MNTLLEATALPNLHPAIVHFPIALLPTALLADLVGRIGRRIRRLEGSLDWARPGAVCLYTLAVLSALAARFTGERAEDGLVGLAAELHPRIATHDDWALYTTISLAIVAALSIAGYLLRGRPRLGQALGLAALGLGLVTGGLLARTADLGGALVFRHGIAVEARAPIEVLETQVTPSDPPESRLVRTEDGSIDWQPRSDDGAILAQMIRLGAGEGLVVEGSDGSEVVAGLHLRLDSPEPVYLLFPDAIGDAEVRAWLSIETLQGTVGVAHHADSIDSVGRFVVGDDGRAELGEVRGGKAKVLDSAGSTAGPLEGSIELAVTVSGRHLKGLVGQDTVAHGHTPPLSGARAGLVFQGSGSIVLVRVRVTKL